MSPPESGRKLHHSHLIALRAGPYFLAAVGVYLLLIGTLAGEPQTESITATVLGVGCSVTAGVLTRTQSLEFDRAKVKASLAPIIDLEAEQWAVAVSSGPTGDARPKEIEGATSSAAPTVAALLAAAPSEGWRVGSTTGSTHATLTKTRLQQGKNHNAGDTLTVHIPVSDLLAPVPTEVWAALADAGFPQPTA